MWILSLVCSEISDFIMRRGYVSVGVGRKIFNTIGLWTPAALLIGLGYVSKENTSLAVVLLTTAIAFNSASFVGYLISKFYLNNVVVNYIEMFKLYSRPHGPFTKFCWYSNGMYKCKCKCIFYFGSNVCWIYRYRCGKIFNWKLNLLESEFAINSWDRDSCFQEWYLNPFIWLTSSHLKTNLTLPLLRFAFQRHCYSSCTISSAKPVNCLGEWKMVPS